MSNLILKYHQDWEILKQLQTSSQPAKLHHFSHIKSVKNAINNISIVKSEDPFHPECKLDLILKFILSSLNQLQFYIWTIFVPSNFHRYDSYIASYWWQLYGRYKMNSYSSGSSSNSLKMECTYECNGKFIWMWSS